MCCDVSEALQVFVRPEQLFGDALSFCTSSIARRKCSVLFASRQSFLAFRSMTFFPIPESHGPLRSH